MNTEDRIHDLLTSPIQGRIMISFPDIEVEMIRDQRRWTIHIRDTGEDAPDFTKEVSKHTLTNLTDVQAGAIVGLCVGLGEDGDNPADEDMVARLYEHAEPCFDGVPRNLRIIP